MIGSLRRPAGDGFGLDDAIDRAQEMCAHLVGERAHGQFDACLGRNDVGLGAGVDGADGDDRSVEGRDFARDDRLERQHRARGDDDGIDGGFRPGAMAAGAEDRDADGVAVAQHRTGAIPDQAGGVAGVVVHRERIVRPREAGEQAVVDHPLRAAQRFLGRLAHQHERAGPPGAIPGHDARGRHPRGHVEVVAARVHHARRRRRCRPWCARCWRSRGPSSPRRAGRRARCAAARPARRRSSGRRRSRCDRRRW